jgi:uncharacterized membrane protein YgdD (TMEM256/DUF423 family)
MDHALAMLARRTLTCGALLGASGVALGAFGAHALRARLDATGQRDVWDLASRYQLVHAVVLVAFAAWLRSAAAPPPPAAAWAVRLWTLGVVLFSGSLYWLSLFGARFVWPLTPLGGLALIAAWILAAVAGGRS